MCVVVLVVLAAGCDWSQYGYNGARTNANVAEPSLTVAAAPTFSDQWDVTCVWSCFSPLAAGNLLYTSEHLAGVDPRPVALHAFNASDGTARWSALFEDIYHAEFVAVGNGLAYATVVGPDEPGAEILAFDATSGVLRWRIPLPGGGFPSGNNFILDGSRLLVATNRSSTASIWTVDTAGKVALLSGAPGGFDEFALDSNRQKLYVASHVRLTTPADAVVPFLTGINALTGAVDSQIQLPRPIEDLRFANDLLYANSCTSGFCQPSALDRTYAFRPDTGAMVWSASSGERIFAVTSSETISRAGTNLTARNALTGAVKWSVTAPTLDAVIGGQLIFSPAEGAAGGIDARSLATGALLGTMTTPFDTGFQTMITAGSRVFGIGADQLVGFAPASA